MGEPRIRIIVSHDGNVTDVSTTAPDYMAAVRAALSLLADLAGATPDRTGAERYLAGRLDDPEYRAAYSAALPG